MSLTRVELERLAENLTVEDLEHLDAEALFALRDNLRKSVHGSWPYQEDPAGWARHNGIFLWSGQKAILESVRDNRRTAVVATYGVGKSFTAAQVVVWWIDQHPPGQARVVTTAPTNEQVKLILWYEIKKAHRLSGAHGDVMTTQWKIDNDIVAVGRKPADHKEGTFQGLHVPYMLVVLDECSGITSALWDDAEKLITGEGCRILAIGNPDVEGSKFHQKTQSELWDTIRISFYDSPASTGEKVPPIVEQSLVSQLWVDEQIQEHGEDSSHVQRLVHGRFVTDSADGIVSRRRLLESDQVESEDGERVAGIDVGGGVDRTVCRLRIGNTFADELIITSTEPEEIAAQAASWLEAVEAERAHVDEIGVGRGLIGHLRDTFTRTGIDCEIVGINVATAPLYNDDDNDWPQMVNRRDEIWWEFRVAVADGAITWETPIGDDPELLEELTETRYREDTRGRVKVEPKVDLKKRIGRSPDRADAVLLAYTSPDYGATGLFWA